jgi:hypothetical protein
MREVVVVVVVVKATFGNLNSNDSQTQNIVVLFDYKFGRKT